MLPPDEIKHLLANDDVKGLEVLFNEYHHMVFKTAYYLLKDEEEAKDFVQELFAKIWTQRTSLSAIDNFKSYLNTAMKNMVLDHFKKSANTEKNKQSYLLLEWDPQYDHTNDFDQPEELKKQLEQFVSELPPQCRLIFSLNRFEGLTNTEIATHLNLSPRTVEKQISIALKILREKAGQQSNKLLSIALNLTAL